jgi:hypothetical protein
MSLPKPSACAFGFFQAGAGFGMDTIPSSFSNKTNIIKPKYHMQLQLVPGLHTAIIANASPGYGGSQFSLETYVVCKNKAGIPAILATFDHSREYPNLGSDLRRLFMPGIRESPQSHPQNMDDLSQVIDEAGANR